ncbi:MAG TPA: 16S rRNA (guanine(966)-N(2))-methyltransferase RsmD [Pseudogracilibacillus sp.]|nr:16S rRNA (guanine(966)-N(2))-methyltransferase RsmD [Pseudogracilibacillus sp.]
MRVIAGKYKGRKLKQVPGTTTRPTTDKIKEAVFHKMGPYFQGGICLDLFAGSGSLAIEALSRGMNEAICIDQSKTAIRIIRENISALQLEKECYIYRNDALRALKILHRKQQTFDLICIDPPYDSPFYDRIITYIIENKMINDRGYMYVEYATEKQRIPRFNTFDIVFERTYSSTTSVLVLKNIT